MPAGLVLTYGECADQANAFIKNPVSVRSPQLYSHTGLMPQAVQLTDLGIRLMFCTCTYTASTA